MGAALTLQGTVHALTPSQAVVSQFVLSVAALQFQILARRRMSLEGVREVVEVEQDQVRVQTDNTEVKEVKERGLLGSASCSGPLA